MEHVELNEEDGKRLAHCTDCGVCVIDIDHHCGFFDKCIVAENFGRFCCCVALIMINMVVALANMAK